MKLLAIEVLKSRLYLRNESNLNKYLDKDLNLKFQYGLNKETKICQNLSEYRNTIQVCKKKKIPIYSTNNELNNFLFSNYDVLTNQLSDYNLLNFDIETSYDNERGYGTIKDPHQAILTICYQLNGQKPIIFTTKPIDFDIEYEVHCFETEKDMLQAFVDLFKNENIHIVTGWNIKFYDIPYLIARTNLFGINYNAMSMVDEVNKLIDKELEEVYYRIKGLHILDYCQLYKKFNYLNETYVKLNTVVKQELKSEKVKYIEEYDNLRDLYDTNYKLFLEYNAKDVELVTELDQKLNFLELTIKIQNLCMNPNLESIFSTLTNSISLTIKYYLNLYGHFPEYLDSNAIDQLRYKNDEYGSIIGGYVVKPKPGVYKNIVVLDFTSLYPSIIRTFNIGTDTFMGESTDLGIVRPRFSHCDKEEYTKLRDKFFKDYFNVISNTDISPNFDHNLTGNGTIYRSNTPSALATMMTDLFEQRVNTRKIMKTLDPSISEYKSKDLEQLAYKILLNSQFGALGNKYFIYGSYQIAESITSTGQFIIKKVINELINLGYNVIYSDTDSLFLSLDQLENSNLELIQNYINLDILPKIDETVKHVITNQLHTKNNNFLEMTLENIFKKGIFWSTKKRYYLKDFKDNIKAKGISSVKSDLSPFYKDIFNKCIELKLNEVEDEKILLELNEIKDKYKTKMLAFTLRTQLKYNISKYQSTELDRLRTLKKSHKKVYEMLNSIEFEDLPEKDISDIVDIYREGCKDAAKKYVQAAYKMLNDEYIQGTPAHFKGAYAWNKLIKLKGLQDKYEYITGGVSVMRLPIKNKTIESDWLSVPIKYENKFNWDLIDIDDVDYDTLFESNVVQKIKSEIF